MTLLHMDPAAKAICREFDPLKICVGISNSYISGQTLGTDLERLYGVVAEFSTDKVVQATTVVHSLVELGSHSC